MTSSSPVSFTNIQKMLYDALLAKAPLIAESYRSATEDFLHSRGAFRGPGYAHALRLIMQALPPIFDVPINKESKVRLGDLTRNVTGAWEKMTKKGRWPGSPKWIGEIDSALKNVLEKVEAMICGDAKIRPAQKEQAKILLRKQYASKKALPGHIEDRKVTTWLDHHSYFSGIAHKLSLDSKGFDELSLRISSFEEIAVSWLVPQTFNIRAAIKNLVEEIDRHPSEVGLDSMEKLITQPVELDYFLEIIESSDWLLILENKKYFNNPPEPELESEYVRFPHWPMSQYLVKVAEKNPKEVVNIIKCICKTSNCRIHSDYLKTAIIVPAEYSVQLSEMVGEWINDMMTQPNFLFVEIGDYIAHLQCGGYHQEALKLVAMLFKLREFSSSLKEENSFKFNARHLALRDWQYNDFLQKITQVFTGNDRFELIKTLCEKLKEIISLQHNLDEQLFQDYSYIWRESIKGYGIPDGIGVEHVLIDHIFALSVCAVEEEHTLAQKVLDYLCDLSYPIFSRIALSVVANSNAKNEVIGILTKKKLFESMEVWPEYAELLAKSYPLIELSQQTAILDMIAAITNSTDADEIERKQYYYYVMIKDYLTGDSKQQFEKCKNKFGILKDPGRLIQSQSWVGPTSPISSDDLSKLPHEELAQYLREWIPPGEVFGESISGLSRELQKVVREKLPEFLQNLKQLQDIHPIYVVGILHALLSYERSWSSNDWSYVVDYFKWISEQQNNQDNEGILIRNFENESNWANPQMDVCRLLQIKLQEVTCECPITLRKKIWAIINNCIQQSFIIKTDEDRLGSSGDYTYAANNSLLGVAFESVIAYENRFGNSESPSEVCSEVLEGLNQLVDPTRGSVKSIRALYGKHLFWFIKKMPKWFEFNYRLLFPTEQENAGFWLVTWEAYLSYYRFNLLAFKRLYEHYELAILAIGKSKSTFINSDELLVEHLMLAFLAGELDTTSHLLNDLYSKINMALKYRALEFVGRTLDTEGYSAEAIERAKSLWIFRLEKCIRNQKNCLNEIGHELMAFKYWVSLKSLDEKWVLEQLQTLLKHAKVFKLNTGLINRLVRSVDSQPVQVSEILERMVNISGSTEERWGWDNSLKTLFQSLLDTGAQEKTKLIIHKLGAFGHTQYSDLLTQS